MVQLATFLLLSPSGIKFSIDSCVGVLCVANLPKLCLHNSSIPCSVPHDAEWYIYLRWCMDESFLSTESATPNRKWLCLIPQIWPFGILPHATIHKLTIGWHRRNMPKLSMNVCHREMGYWSWKLQQFFKQQFERMESLANESFMIC